MEAIRETGKAPGNARGTDRNAPEKVRYTEKNRKSGGYSGKHRAQEAKHKAGVDARIVRFLKKHHVLTLATSGEGAPYCSNAFYCYDAERNLLIFTSDMATRHAQQMARNPCVAASVVLETKVVGRVQGLQLCGKAERADEAARRAYLKRFPYAVLAELTLWAIAPRLYEIHRQHARIRKKTDMEQQIGVIIVAGGGGTRMGGRVPSNS